MSPLRDVLQAPESFVTAMVAAEWAGLGVYARSVLGTTREDDPSVVSLRLTCTHDRDGCAVIECEFLNESGMAVAGFGL
jgi:hypothetical protein